jgi:hypothetical protein
MGILFGRIVVRRVLESLVQNWRRKIVFGFEFEKKRLFKKRL